MQLNIMRYFIHNFTALLAFQSVEHTEKKYGGYGKLLKMLLNQYYPFVHYLHTVFHCTIHSRGYKLNRLNNWKIVCFAL